jgi:hypothetical protein
LTKPALALGGGFQNNQGIATNGTIAVLPNTSGQVMTTDNATLSTSTSVWGLRFQQFINGLSFGYFYGNVPTAYLSSAFTITNIDNVGTYTYRTSSWTPINVNNTPTTSNIVTGRTDSIVYAGTTYYFPKDQSGYFSSTNLSDFTDYTFSDNINANGTYYIAQSAYPFMASNGTNMVVTNRLSSTLRIGASPLTNAPSFATPVSLNLGMVEIN